MKLLRLRISCPACGTVPALRITVRERDLHLELEAELLVATYQCHHRRCREVYALPARAYREAG